MYFGSQHLNRHDNSDKVHGTVLMVAARFHLKSNDSDAWEALGCLDRIDDLRPVGRRG